MSEPRWLDCASAGNVPPPRELAALAQPGRHVVLRLPSLSGADRQALVQRLVEALPDHAVFNSGGAEGRTWITVLPVVSRERVRERLLHVRRAVADYRRTCDVLVAHYQADRLPPAWQADEHGEHCRFENLHTGQIVEAPLPEGVTTSRVDPYFFALFVRSTVGLESVADLLAPGFHDAVRVLEVVESEAHSRADDG